MIVFWIALVCFGAVAALLLRARRRLLELDDRCLLAAQEVDAELARIHALLLALVGLMRTFAAQENMAIDRVAQAHAAARRAASPQAKLLAETRLSDGVHALLAQAHAVPQIQTLSDFRALQAALDEAERRLTAGRRALSAATVAYNQALGRFPERLFAPRLRLGPRAFYDIGAEQARAGQAMAGQA